MSHRHRRYSKRELLGSLHVDYVMSVTDLGLAAGSNRWDVLRAFLAVGEARAERLVEEDNGFLILQSIPGRPNTGGIYLYAENLQSFFWLRRHCWPNPTRRSSSRTVRRCPKLSASYKARTP